MPGGGGFADPGPAGGHGGLGSCGAWCGPSPRCFFDSDAVETGWETYPTADTEVRAHATRGVVPGNEGFRMDTQRWLTQRFALPGMRFLVPGRGVFLIQTQRRQVGKPIPRRTRRSGLPRGVFWTQPTPFLGWTPSGGSYGDSPSPPRRFWPLASLSGRCTPSGRTQRSGLPRRVFWTQPTPFLGWTPSGGSYGDSPSPPRVFWSQAVVFF
jgi:hypothetical protein